MNNEEAFLVWAPNQVCWSDWAKPVAFAQATATSAPASNAATQQAATQQATTPSVTTPAPNVAAATSDAVSASVRVAPSDWRTLALDWLPSPRDTAIIVDLPGPSSVTYGLAMAQRGYRPVPIFNACTGPSEIVNMQQVIRGLLEGAGELAGMAIPAQAPPAFLLDSERLQGGSSLQPGRFDNRWMVFPQDFPSANVLLSQQIRRALIVRLGSPTIPEDLAHVLLRWQEAKVELTIHDAQSAGPPQPLQVQSPKRFKSIWYRLLAMTGLRRNSAGGFGSVIPQPASGGGAGFG